MYLGVTLTPTIVSSTSSVITVTGSSTSKTVHILIDVCSQFILK